MQHYPTNAGTHMSEVQHGAKMLVDLPPEQGSPMVQVNSQSFFIHELLQLQSGEFFIPRRFFRNCPSGVSNGSIEELMALGLLVENTTVSTCISFLKYMLIFVGRVLCS